MTNKTNLIKCLFNQHDFSKKMTGYKQTKICVRCLKKSYTCYIQGKRYRYRIVKIFGDVVDNKIVHYGTGCDERWLSNGGGLVYDKRRKCIRAKRQVWRKKKPKNWVYEVYFE